VADGIELIGVFHGSRELEVFSRGSTSAWRERAWQSEPEACAGRPPADARKHPAGPHWRPGACVATLLVDFGLKYLRTDVYWHSA
jgi:hypothetical protein